MASRECSSSFGPQIQDRDPQSIDGMEQCTEKDEDLEGPVRINVINGAADLSSEK
jgi:hypothetical protein